MISPSPSIDRSTLKVKRSVSKSRRKSAITPRATPKSKNNTERSFQTPVSTNAMAMEKTKVQEEVQQEYCKKSVSSPAHHMTHTMSSAHKINKEEVRVKAIEHRHRVVIEL